MKIMQIMPEFGLAGAETMCENLTNELIKFGEDVVVVSLYDYHSAITDRLEKNNVRIIYLNKKPGLDLSIIIKLIKILKKEKPDVLHTHRYVMQYVIPAAILTRIKRRVHTVHNIAKMENTGIARKLNYFFYKFAHVTPVALSGIVQKTVIEEYHLNPTKVPVVLNGINLSKCRIKEEYSIKKNFTILHIGRFSEQKNHVGLISAYKTIHEKYPNTILELVGDGEKKSECEKLVQGLGLKSSVRFCGHQNNVFDLLQQADLFVLPSNYEGIPMTLIEAMGTGLPIVATAVGGIPDMLEDGKDALIVQNKKDELIKAISKMIDEKKLREKLGHNAVQRAKDFSSDVMAKQYLNLYKNGLGDKK